METTNSNTRSNEFSTDKGEVQISEPLYIYELTPVQQHQNEYEETFNFDFETGKIRLLTQDHQGITPSS